MGYKVFRNAHIFGMLPVRYYTVPDRKSGYAIAHGYYCTYIAVPQWQRLSQLVKYCLQSRPQTFSFYLADHLFYPVWLLHCFLQQVCAAKLNKHPLCAQRYKSS
jgi:hypothetical protein